VLLIADASLFRMQGVFPIAVSFAANAVIAVLAAREALGRDAKVLPVLIAFCALLGIMWSTSQWLNWLIPFQVGFPLEQMCALLTFLCLSNAIEDQEAAPRILWLAAAAVFDFLTVFSIGSGVALIAPALALLFWLRAPIRGVAVPFILCHCAIVGPIILTPMKKEFAGFDGPRPYLKMVAQFMASPFGLWQPYVVDLGLALMATIGAAMLAVTTYVVARRRPIDRAIACSLALGFFVLIQGMGIAYARAKYGMVHRYTPLAICAFVALLVVEWRCGEFLQPPFRSIARLAGIAATAVCIVGTSPPVFEQEWRTFSGQLGRGAAELRKGTGLNDDIIQAIAHLPPWGWLQSAVERVRVLRLGPFAP
jgi:hypothetical protein